MRTIFHCFSLLYFYSRYSFDCYAFLIFFLKPLFSPTKPSFCLCVCAYYAIIAVNAQLAKIKGGSQRNGSAGGSNFMWLMGTHSHLNYPSLLLLFTLQYFTTTASAPGMIIGLCFNTACILLHVYEPQIYSSACVSLLVSVVYSIFLTNSSKAF